MPFLRKPALLPVKGINLSIPSSYLPDGFGFPQNLQYFRGELRNRDGKTKLGGQTLGNKKVLHLGTQQVSTGVLRLFRMTTTNIQKFNTVTSVWDDITGIDMTGSESDFFSDTVVTESDLYLFTNRGIDPIRKYDGSGNTANLGGSPPKARYLAYLSPYVLLAFTESGGNAFPTKVQWSDTGQPEVWSGGNSGSQLLSNDPSHIRQMKTLKDTVMVYKELAVWRGRKVATSDIFDFVPFASGKGLYAPRSVADDGENHYYMGNFDFHINNGIRVIDIGKPVREYIFNRLNRSKNETCHAIHVEQYKEIWFFITLSGLDWPTEVWKYSYENDFWYFDTVQNIICANVFKQVNTLTWNDTIGTWNEQVTIWDDQQGDASAPLTVFGHDTAVTSRLDNSLITDLGSDVEAKLETRDYTGLDAGGIERDVRWLQFDIWARGRTAKFYYSLDEGSTWVFVSENTLESTTTKSTFWFDTIAEKIRFRIILNGTLRSFQPYYLDAGEIRR